MNGPESFAFPGKPMEFSPQTILGLKYVESGTMKQIISILALEEFRGCRVMSAFPVHQRKAVVVDEEWLFMQIPAVAKFLERVSRVGEEAEYPVPYYESEACGYVGRVEG